MKILLSTFKAILQTLLNYLTCKYIYHNRRVSAVQCVLVTHFDIIMHAFNAFQYG